MAHLKYRYFARIARAAGDEDTAKAFEETADQEVQHALGHLDLLYPAAELTPARVRRQRDVRDRLPHRSAGSTAVELLLEPHLDQ